MKIIVVGLLTLFLVTACSKDSNPSPVNKNGDPIISRDFSNGTMVFPDGVPLFISLIKLNEPALLSVVDENGKVDPQAKQALLEEQAGLIKKLQGISPQINVLYRYYMVLNAIAIEAPQALAWRD